MLFFPYCCEFVCKILPGVVDVFDLIFAIRMVNGIFGILYNQFFSSFDAVLLLLLALQCKQHLQAQGSARLAVLGAVWLGSLARM